MKYFPLVLLLSAILIPIYYTTAYAQNQSANQSNTNDQNKTGQTEQDKAVKNVTQSTSLVAKQATETLGQIGNQVGQAFKNITETNTKQNISNK